MQPSNMSDIIEEYLKNVLLAQEKVEIRRSEIADRFNCVPSQINYVINTRFTVQQGYVVESKRGGGGYIRIMKVNLVDDMDILDALLEVVPEELSMKQANHILQNLYDNELLSKREAQLLNIAIIASSAPSEVENSRNQEQPSIPEKTTVPDKSSDETGQPTTTTVSKQELPNTGTSEIEFFTPAVLAILSGLGLVIPTQKKKTDEE